MEKISFSELVNISSLEKMATNLYAAAGIPVGIIDVDGTIYVKTGWQDICTKFHRVHSYSEHSCLISDRHINEHIIDGRYIEYKCLYNMWDIGVPIIIAGKHLATIFLGQFFYDDEIVDTEFFRTQALKFGFDEKEYLEALSRVPRFSREKIQYIIEYYVGLVMTLAESGLRQLEYKNSQKELAKNQKYLNTIFDSVSDAVFIHDFQGKIIDVNHTAVSMFGYSKDELIHMTVKDIISEEFYTKLELLGVFDKAITNSPIILEGICRTKSNNAFWVEVGSSAIQLYEKEEVIATVRDITDRKLGELELQKEAQEIEILKTEFFANISHELKTPLNIILSAIQVIGIELKDEEKPVDRVKVFRSLNIEKQNCFRLLRLINNLIDSTKLDSGYFELNMVNCNIVNIVEEITLSVAEYIKSNSLCLTFDTDVEEKLLACDLDKIERIMLNLLSNAVKFTPPGGKIFVNIYDGEEYITINVEDTGIGIPSQKLNIIFDRFMQVDKSFTRNYEGSGIGLSLVKSLVEMQGGTISVESKYGIGTKFFVRIPVKVLNNGSDEENTNQENSAIGTWDCVERIKMEFSDIYK